MRLLVLISLALLLCAVCLVPCGAEEQFRDAYLPVKIELFFAYTLNFSLTVPKVGLAGAVWTETKNNRYMSFECKDSRSNFLIIFEVRYPQPVEQILTVKFSEGTRPTIIEHIHYTNGVADGQATSREPPTAYICRRYWIRTLPEPTDPNEIVRLLNLRQSQERKDFEAKIDSRLNGIDNSIIFGNVLWVIVAAALTIALIVFATRRAQP